MTAYDITTITISNFTSNSTIDTTEEGAGWDSSDITCKHGPCGRVLITSRVSGRGNVFGPVRLSVCEHPHGQTGTQTRNLVEGCIWTISRTNSIFKVKGQDRPVKNVIFEAKNR